MNLDNLSKGLKPVLPYIVVLGLLMITLNGWSQSVLTPDQAVRIAIENNYGIQMAERDIQVAANNATKTALGYQPTINATGGPSLNLGSSKQQFGNGGENKVSNAFSYRANASVDANYVIYDEARATSLEQLREVLNLSNLQLRQTIEINVLQIISLYYEIAKLTSNLNVLAQTIDLSNDRLQRVQYQFDYGQGIGLDVLNARVDVQRDSINYFNTLQLLENTKRDLNVLLASDLNADFQVDTTVNYSDIQFDSLLNDAMAQNIDLLLLAKNYDITAYDLKVIESERKPRISANGSYTFSFQDNPPGAFTTFSTSRGLNLGANLSWNIFDGGLRKVREQNTQIALETQRLQQDQVELQLRRDLTNAWEAYQTSLFILKSEEVNLETSHANFDRTEERFNIGQVSSVEFRQAQLNLLNASVSYNNAKYDAKLIELQLQQMAGNILSALEVE